MGRFDKAIKPNFGSKDMAQVWSADNMIQKLLDVEVALAKVECSLGIVPKEAYEEIERKGKFENLDPELYEKTLAVAGHSLVTLIRCFQAVCENGAGQYIHWGATSQDIMDTGQILQILYMRPETGHRTLLCCWNPQYRLSAVWILCLRHFSRMISGISVPLNGWNS